MRAPGEITDEFSGLGATAPAVEVVPLDVTDLAAVQAAADACPDVGLDALDRGEHVADTDLMAVEARARYARDPIRYERAMTKLLKVTTMDAGR